MVKTSSYFCLHFADDKAHNKQGRAFFLSYFLNKLSSSVTISGRL